MCGSQAAPDLAKTKLQDQVKLAAGEVSIYKGGPYTSLFDAMLKTLRYEGLRGWYRGLPVQLIGIVPEKALKLSVNDAMRWQLKSPNGSIALHNEMLAGATAGFLQVIITSPMEMFKCVALRARADARPLTPLSRIRMQLQNNKPVEKRLGIPQVARNILNGGLRTLYQGAASTLMRDVTFSLLYFPMYSNMKLYMARQDVSHPFWGQFRVKGTGEQERASARVNLLGAFACGLAAGSIAAMAVTPADVIKTRLQTESGLEKYRNIRQCVRMTWNEGGVRAFFKGATGRGLLIGPLFGVVLLTYEMLPAIVPL